MKCVFSEYHFTRCFLLRNFLFSNSPFLGQSVQILMLKKIALCLYFTLFLGLLTSCSPAGILHPNESEKATESPPASTAAKPDSKPENSDSETIGAPIAMPPTFGDVPPQPGEDALPLASGMQPMKGINIDQLFSAKIKNTDERFDRIEKAVLDMRKEFESVKPSIVKLTAVESDMQSLIKELEVMMQETPSTQLTPSENDLGANLQVEQLPIEPLASNAPQQAQEQNLATPPPPPLVASPSPEHILRNPHLPAAGAPQNINVAKNLPQQPAAENVLNTPPTPVQPQPSAAAPAPAPTPASTPTAAPAPTYDGLVAKNIRIGEHPGKLRIVLDTNKEANYSVDLDNNEKIIIIELPDAKWVGASSQKFSDYPLVESYSIEPTNSGKGTMIVVTLKAGTEILKEGVLMPDKTSDYRIYFDLKL
jgi:hypothetical protein